MHRKPLLLAALAVPVIFLAVWIGFIRYYINNAPEITIRAEGYDPRSLISGHYLSLRLNWQETDCTQFSDNLCHPGRFLSIYRYYLPEKEALLLDGLRWRRDFPEMELVFAYPKDKQPHLKRLLIEGKNWDEWLAGRSQGTEAAN